jgi:hypothetical protein
MKNSPFTLNCRKQLGRERFREREIKYEKNSPFTFNCRNPIGKI